MAARDRSPALTLFFASDLHGSEVCFRKWLHAGRVYGVEVVLLGGDLTGKSLVLAVAAGGGRWRVRDQLLDAQELAACERRLADAGQYLIHLEPVEAETMAADHVQRDEAFCAAAERRLSSWLDLADERLDGSQRLHFSMAGNDDHFAIDRILERGKTIRWADGRVVDLPLGFQLLSLGVSNHTPWHTPRECEEAEILRRIAALAEQLRDPARAIFNIHVPPYNTTIDVCPELDGELRPVFRGGQPSLVPVGSHAVREALERYQPLLCLCGHVHEARGWSNVGRTRCINPGSAYTEGVLQGCLVSLRAGEVAAQQFSNG